MSLLRDMQQRSDHPSGTRSHEKASRARLAWEKAKDLTQDMNAVAKAKAFEDAPPLKRKRVAACCGVSGLTLATVLQHVGSVVSA